MPDSDSPSPPPVAPKTVQEYIDERPAWADGTNVGLTPMTGMQLRIWALACAGKFFEGIVVFMTGGCPAADLDRIRFEGPGQGLRHRGVARRHLGGG
jgi:hypothetical protein